MGIELPRSEWGLVPELEERESAVFVGYRWTEWTELDYRERARSVAHYRIHLMIDAHTQEAVHQDAERKSRKARAKGRN